MDQTLRLMCILAHPDDESLGTGGILAKYAAEGVETSLVTATRGELGWFDDPEKNPGPEALGRIREQELGEAARALSLREFHLLDYHDGEFDQADPAEVLPQIVAHLRRVRPHVAVTFDQHGLYGHPDHIAISRHATAAIVAAADGAYRPDLGEPHAVTKLYYMVWRAETQAAYEAAFGELTMEIDGDRRRPVVWPDWSITTWVDTADYWETVWSAISCHRTQLPGYEKLSRLSEEHHRNLWGAQTYHRVFSTVPAPWARETDLFAGLR